jgi:adenylosuccinate synthase
MPVTIVVGGQYGSEGKGKVVALLADESDRPWLVRCGGPNSGHTVTINGEEVVLRQVPCCTEPTRAKFFIAAGCAVDESVLIAELDFLGIEPDRIVVDPRAVLVTDRDREAEENELRYMASTCSGTGESLRRRMSRRSDVGLVKDSDKLRSRCRIQTVASVLHDGIDHGRTIIIEGSQGFGLSLLHGPAYPFVTSRDTTASGFASEVGISPRDITDIVMVVRTFPIRVGGTSGPLRNEISWDDVRRISGAPEVRPEYTSVTKRLRRVAEFRLEEVKLACAYNRPSALAVMGIDRLDFANTAIQDVNNLTKTGRLFLEELELEVGIPIAFIGTGFGTFDAIQVQRKTLVSAGECLTLSS